MPTRWSKLSDLADVSLGYKSLQNAFFYVDSEAIRRFGIERRFLREEGLDLA